MLIETFGPYLHQGMVSNAHRLCHGCGTPRGQHWCARRSQEPVHICMLSSADALKHRRWEVSMELMRDEPAVDDHMQKLTEKVCTDCQLFYVPIIYFSTGSGKPKGDQARRYGMAVQW